MHGGGESAADGGSPALSAIEMLPIPQRLYLPLRQHAGYPSVPCVTVGQKVGKGEVIGRADVWGSVPLHAPTSGTVVAVTACPTGHPTGLTQLAVVIEPDGAERWSEAVQGMVDPLNAAPSLLREQIRAAGIVGLGDECFPSHLKLTPPRGKRVDLLLINGAECEPGLSVHERLMVERANEILSGIQIIMRIVSAKQCFIGIEQGKSAAIQAMTQAAWGVAGVRVQGVPAMRPHGVRQQLVAALTGKNLSLGARLLDRRLLVHNVSTACSIHDAVWRGRPLLSRVLTVAGGGIARPANLEALIGTPLRHLIDHCGGLQSGVDQLFLGGPLLGQAVNTQDVPVLKSSTAVLSFLPAAGVAKPQQPCIRCGRCVEACPMGLVPAEMARRVRKGQLMRVAELQLHDCTECGFCGFVCPSHIPLLDTFRYAKWVLQAEKWGRQPPSVGGGHALSERDGTAGEPAVVAPPAVVMAEAVAVREEVTVGSASGKGARAVRAAHAARAAKAAKASRDQAK
ncbi:MAG: electron transport complex subunit RsxC [Magnetococcales bacterium]|nr:electron transport complex subunit RsxC [Magnetococcales bacterium]MBF0116859.1 electron transport complex subunit RsxC [Magnetococcales bacterium]